VDANPSGTLLTIDSYRFRFPERSVTQIHALIDPLRPIIGSFNEITDPPPSPLTVDLSVEATSEHRAEVWYSDWIAEDFPALVLDSMDWLAEQPGVELVEQEDHCVFSATGRFEVALFDHLRSWWMERVDGFDQTCDWLVPAH